MSNEELYNDLLNKLHKEHAFWSFHDTDQISDGALIANVLLHLDIDEIISLFKLFPKRTIQKVWKEKMLAQEPMYHGLNRLYAFLLFNIKDPDRYIADYRNKRNKSLSCKV